MRRIETTIMCAAGILAFLVASASVAQAGGTFQLNKVLDTDTLVPGEGGATFTSVDEPPALSDGTIFGPMRFGSPTTEAFYTATVGGTPVEIAREGDPMPDGVSTIKNFAIASHDISGTNLAFTPFRVSTNDAAYFATLGGTLQLVAEPGVTAIPDGSGDIFIGVENSECCPLFGDVPAFEGFGPSAKNGIYARVDGTLVKMVQNGDPSPNGSTYSGSFDEPDIQVQDVVFEARTHAGAKQGIFGLVGGSAVAVATTDTTVPGQGDTFTFLDNPQISGSAVLFNANSVSTVEGLYRVDISPTVGAPTEVVEVGDPVPSPPNQTFSSLREAGISMGGDLIAFEGVFNGGSDEGIFVNFEGSLINIVDSTQMLDGKTVSAVDLEGEGVDGNQVAFEVSFDDGSEAIYIASAACPATLVFANETLSGVATYQAKTRITLGSNLMVDGTAIAMRSPTVALSNETRIQGDLTARNATTCP